MSHNAWLRPPSIGPSRWGGPCTTDGCDLPAVVVRRDGPHCAACQYIGQAEDPHEEEALSRLYPYQLEGVRWLRRSRAALLADDMGLGKTPQALLAASTIGWSAPIVVVCPASLRLQWQRAATETWRTHLPGDVRVQVRRQKTPAPTAGQILIVGYPWLRQAELPIEPERGTLVIYDEAQALKNPQSAQTRGARRLSDAALAVGGGVWLLTATPARANGSELWHVLRAAGLEQAIARHPDRAQEDPYGVASRLPRVCLRRTPEDCGVDLPSVVRDYLPVSLPSVSAGEVDAAAREALSATELSRIGKSAYSVARAAGRSVAESQVAAAEAAESARAESVARVAMLDSAEAAAELEEILAGDGGEPGALSRMRAALAKAKLPVALALAEAAIDSGSPEVILSAHRALGEEFRRRGWPTVIGGQSPATRAAEVARFVSGSEPVIGGTLACCAEGVDGLQRVSRVLTLVDRDWTPAVTGQAIGRLVRLGQGSGSVLIRLLVADHWVDHVVEACCGSKRHMLEALGLGLGEAWI